MRLSKLMLLLMLLTAFACSRPGSEGEKGREPADNCAVLIGECDKSMSQKDYDSAMEFSLKSLSAAEEDGHDRCRADAMIKVATISMMTSEDSNSWEYACRAEELSRRTGYSLGVADALIIKGKLCLYACISPEEERDDEGIGYAEEALAVSIEDGLTPQMAEACYVLAELYIRLLS